MLLYFTVNPNIKTFNNKQTPAHYAAKYDAVDALKILMKYGADLNEVDSMERTPLYVAAEFGECSLKTWLKK